MHVELAGAGVDFTDRIDDKTHGRIRSYLESRDDWNFS